MKNYTITVNGNVYDVTVEETGAGQTAAPVQRAAAPAPKPAASAQKATAPAPAAGGSIKVNSPMPGKILAVKAEVGQTVKKGEVILLLEAMKMENEIVAPGDGTVASINIAVNDSVEAGDLLATLK